MPVIGIGGSGYQMLQMSLPNTTINLQLKKIEESGHFILSEKPDEVARYIIEFLEQ
ncbi:hypothetical protein D3C72_2098250 [compost metagenome]